MTTHAHERTTEKTQPPISTKVEREDTTKKAPPAEADREMVSAKINASMNLIRQLEVGQPIEQRQITPILDSVKEIRTAFDTCCPAN
jgi:hypothetical protein